MHWLLLASVFASLSADSEQPASVSTTKGRPPNETASSNLGSVPAQPPTSVQLFATLKTAEERAKEAEAEREKTTRDRWMVWLNAIYVLLTLFIAFFTGRLWWTGKKTAQRQLRAYVFEQADMEGLEQIQGFLVAQVAIKNAGLTPAHDVEAWAALVHLNEVEYCSHSFKAQGVPITTGKFVVNPGSLHTVGARISDRSADPNQSLYLYGEIAYRDVFGDRHFTRFRLRKLSIPNAIWGYCAEGNEAD